MSKLWRLTKQIVFCAVLAAYVLLLVKALLFKNVHPLNVFSADRTIQRPCNIVPLKSIHEYLSGGNIWVSLMNVLGNVAIFVPMGVYLQTFKRRMGAAKCVAVLFAVSLGVEIAQFVLGIGAADIDDILLNTIGGALGVLFYRIVYAVVKDDGKARMAFTCLFCLSPIFVYALLRLAGLHAIRFF